MVYAEFTLKRSHGECTRAINRAIECSILQSAMLAAKGKIMPYLPSQHHLCIFQRLIVQQPVQFCSLCRGIAVLVLHGDAVDGNGRAIRESGFHPV